jgi:hypothetical protein
MLCPWQMAGMMVICRRYAPHVMGRKHDESKTKSKLAGDKSVL